MSFERTFEIRVLVPPGTGRDKVARLCNHMTFSEFEMNEWAGNSDWGSHVFGEDTEEVEDEDAEYRLLRGHYREAVTESVLTEKDTFVLDDEGGGFVAPEDATWCWSGEARAETSDD